MSDPWIAYGFKTEAEYIEWHARLKEFMGGFNKKAASSSTTGSESGPSPASQLGQQAADDSATRIIIASATIAPGF